MFCQTCERSSPLSEAFDRSMTGPLGVVKPKCLWIQRIRAFLSRVAGASTIPVMAVAVNSLRIVHYPDPVLRGKAKPVERIDDEVRAVAARMVELMHEARGVGLAAPQVGLPWRLFVANPSGEPGDDRVFINPVLRDPSRETESREEGCLSLPSVTGEITRPHAITVDAQDEHGQRFTLTSDGLPARVWQHETDHLDGIMIIDKMPAIDRVANKRALRDLESGAKR